MIKLSKRKCKIWRLKRKNNKTPPWLELPADVTANILHRLGAVEILEAAQKVCTNWWRLCKDPYMWRVIDLAIPGGDRHDMHFYHLEIMCRHAVDRSQGELIDVNIEYFGTDELLLYIGERCNHLKRLRLALCYDISSKGLTTAVEKFPELEELHLFFMTSITDEDIESIGTSCPKLKSFTYNIRGSRLPLHTNTNGKALAVAKSMPNLQHLQFCGATMKNEGLEAILNGCPRLESLDIRQCFCIDLWGDLGKRCSQQIKYLRRPNDSFDDYEWDSSIYDDHHLYDDCYLSELSYGSYDLYDDFDDYCHDYGDHYYNFGDHYYNYDSAFFGSPDHIPGSP